MKDRVTARVLGRIAALLAVLAVASIVAYLALLIDREKAGDEARQRWNLAATCLRQLDTAAFSFTDVDGTRIETVDVHSLPAECARLLSDSQLLLGDSFHKERAVERLREIRDAAASDAEPTRSQALAGVQWGMFAFVLLAIASTVLFLRLQSRIEAEDFELESDKILRGHTDSPHYDKLVAINVKHLDAYYLLVKGQTSNSFFVTLTVAMAGFAFITAGLVFAFGSASTESTAFTESRFVWIATGSGIVVEFIAAVFFFLYNRTVRQLREYHESLIGVQNTLLAFRMVEQVSAETDQNKIAIIQQVVNYLLGKQDTPRKRAGPVHEEDADPRQGHEA